MSFENFAKIEGLSLMLWESDVYASPNTDLASRAFKAGQQSKQKEVDDLKEKLQSINGKYKHHQGYVWEFLNGEENVCF